MEYGVGTKLRSLLNTRCLVKHQRRCLVNRNVYYEQELYKRRYRKWTKFHKKISCIKPLKTKSKCSESAAAVLHSEEKFRNVTDNRASRTKKRQLGVEEEVRNDNELRNSTDQPSDTDFYD